MMNTYDLIGEERVRAIQKLIKAITAFSDVVMIVANGFQQLDEMLRKAKRRQKYMRRYERIGRERNGKQKK